MYALSALVVFMLVGDLQSLTASGIFFFDEAFAGAV
jgi:hypothetical protein